MLGFLELWVGLFSQVSTRQGEFGLYRLLSLYSVYASKVPA